MFRSILFFGLFFCATSHSCHSAASSRPHNPIFTSLLISEAGQPVPVLMRILTYLQQGGDPCQIPKESFENLVKRVKHARLTLLLKLLSVHPDFTSVQQSSKRIVTTPEPPIVHQERPPKVISKIDLQNEYGETRLYSACEFIRKDLIRILLARGATIDLPGSHCLHYACGQGDEEIVQMFLGQLNAPINALDESNRTPLHLAAYYGHGRIIQMLLKYPGIKINEINRFGKTPLDEAESFEHEYASVVKYRQAIELLQKAGCKRSNELQRPCIED